MRGQVYVRASDLDLKAGVVHIEGGAKTSARWGSLTEWGKVALRRRIEDLGTLGPETPLICGDTSDRTRARANAYASVRASLVRAGLGGRARRVPELDRRLAWCLGAGRGRIDRTGRPPARDPQPGCHGVVHRMGLVGMGAWKPDPGPAASLAKVEAIFSNPALYELAAAIPEQVGPGRHRSYPDYAVIAFAALISVWRSARQVEAELSHPLVWRLVRRIVAERFPDRPQMHLPPAPMRRHHYTYLRDRYLTDPAILSELGRLHRECALAQARDAGLLDPESPGSFTHPDLSRMIHADGKVVTPLYRAKPGDVRQDKRTGGVRKARAEPDAALHFEGDGEAAWGTKFVLVAARSVQGRVILDVEHVASPGGEASVAMDCFTRLIPLAPGALGVIYDTALRGTHHHRLLRELGVICVNRVTAAENHGGARAGWKGVRIEKSIHVEDRELRLADGTRKTLRLFAQAGAIGIVEFLEDGSSRFLRLKRRRIHRNRLKDGTYAWYEDFVLPPSYGEGTITVRLHGNDEDAARGLNRAENVRAIPPGDPDFYKLYARRNDSESLNRLLEDSLYIGRAHSLGHARQQVEILGWALMVNSLTLARRPQHSLPLTA